jgi:hypothetical protein
MFLSLHRRNPTPTMQAAQPLAAQVINTPTMGFVLNYWRTRGYSGSPAHVQYETVAANEAGHACPQGGCFANDPLTGAPRRTSECELYLFYRWWLEREYHRMRHVAFPIHGEDDDEADWELQYESDRLMAFTLPYLLREASEDPMYRQ